MERDQTFPFFSFKLLNDKYGTGDILGLVQMLNEEVRGVAACRHRMFHSS